MTTLTFNGIPSVKDDAGDYIVLTDYGQEGLKVSTQTKTLQEALAWIVESHHGSPTAILKLVRARAEEVL